MTEDREKFLGLITQVTGDIAGLPLDAALEERLNAHVPPSDECSPGSDHRPTVTGGDAYIVYRLPEGAIEFTGK